MSIWPQICVSIPGSTTLVNGQISSDGNYLTYSIPVPGGSVEGTYYVDGPNVGQYSFTTVGNVQSPLTITEILDGGIAENKGYQNRPEDEIQVICQYEFFDSVPWNRSLPAGGEVINVEENSVRDAGFLVDTVNQLIQVIDTDGTQCQVFVVSGNPSDIGYTVLEPISEDSLGQQALAVNTGEISEFLGDIDIHSGKLSTVKYGKMYQIGSINKSLLIADPSHFWNSSKFNNLVCWLHFGEHPSQPYILQDFSDFALTDLDIQNGSFSANYKLNNRVWNNWSGWNLSLSSQTPASSAGFVTINKSRLIGLNFSLNLWLQVQPSTLTASNIVIFSYGPLSLAVSGSSSKTVSAFLTNLSGDSVQIGSSVSVTSTEFNNISLSVQELNIPTALDISVSASINVSNLFGLQTVDGIELESGMSVLLTGQTDQTKNGHYIVSSEDWIRSAVVLNFDERLAWYYVSSGISNSGYYQCQNNTSNKINYGSDNVIYFKFNVSWSGTFGSGNASSNPFKISDTELTITAGNGVGSSTINVFDLMIWSSNKSNSDFININSPKIQPLSISARPTFCTSTTGNFRALQVLPSGYVLPAVIPVNYYAENLSRAVRYNSRGEYVGTNERIETGFGDATVPAQQVTLGLVGFNIPSEGLAIASSSLGGLTNSNPCVPWIYVHGEDGQMYKVFITVSRNLNTDTPALKATLVRRFGISQNENTINQIPLFNGITEILSESFFYNLRLGDDQDTVILPDFVSNSETLIENTNGARLGVIVQNGLPVVSNLTGGTQTTAPIYLYVPVIQILNYNLNNNFSVWQNMPSGTYSYPVPTRDSAGPIILRGNSNYLVPGTYQIILDVADLGTLDSSFSGYNVEIGILGYLQPSSQQYYSTVQVNSILMPGGTSTFSINYDSNLSTELPATCTPQDLQNLLNQIAPNQFTVLTSGTTTSQIGGPFWIEFNNVGTQNLLEFQTSSGFSISVIRTVTGNSSTREIQQIFFNRPLTVIEITLNQSLSVDVGHSWALQIYWTNPLTTTTTVRRLAIFQAWIFLMHTELYALSIS